MWRILDDRTVGRLLPPAAALAGVRTAFGLLGSGDAHDEPRQRSSKGAVTLNVLSAIAPTLDAVAVKSYPVVRRDINRASVITVLVYAYGTGQLRGMMQADLLGQRRTAAASALAAQSMARQDSSTVCLFGTGYQAPAQITALTEVLPRLRTVLVVGRDAERTARTVRTIEEAHRWLTVEPAGAETAVPRADVVITATGAAEPLFDGALLRPGTHINAVGSNHARRRELDGTTLRRAAHVVVDSADVASAECGDLLANGLSPDAATEFASVLSGEVPARSADDDITVFESHGLAVQDLVCAVQVLESAQAAESGTVIDA